MLKAGVNVSQGSFLKHIVFGLRLLTHPALPRPGIPSRGYYIPKRAWETGSLPNYSIHRNICFSLLES